MSQVYRGTIAELAGNVTLGGKVLGQIELSNLTRLGFARSVGSVEKAAGTRGRAATIWELSPQISLSFESETVPLADALPEVAVSANAPTETPEGE